MRRREFITLLGGAAAAWPLSARAQQSDRMRRIGVLMPFLANDPEEQARIVVFEQSLQQLGWTVGRDLQIDYRWPGGDAAPIRRDAAELIARAPDAIAPALPWLAKAWIPAGCSIISDTPASPIRSAIRL